MREVYTLLTMETIVAPFFVGLHLMRKIGQRRVETETGEVLLIVRLCPDCGSSQGFWRPSESASGDISTLPR
jgi:hypothetical protein